MLVYLPILALEGVEGKIFRPMALAVIFALLGSMLFSLTVMPVLARRSRERHYVREGAHVRYRLATRHVTGSSRADNQG